MDTSVDRSELTGKQGYMQMVDNTLRRVQIANVSIDTPYFAGNVDALCSPDAIEDSIIGNIPGA